MDLVGRLGRVEKVVESELIGIEVRDRIVGLKERRSVLQNDRVGGGAKEQLFRHRLKAE